MKFKLFVSVIVLVTVLLSACAPAATPVPTVAPTKAATVAPTAVPATAVPATAKPAEPTKAAVPEVCTKDAFGCAKIATGQTVKIGMGAPMSGDNANFGIDISQGSKIAVIDGGDIQGFKFELVSQDDGGTPEGGAAVANKLVSDPTVVAIAGHIFSGATEAAMAVYEKAGLPMLSPSATNPPLTSKGSKVFNRIAFTDATQGKFAAEYLFKKLGIKKLAAMHDGQAYGKGLAEVVRDNFKALGGEVVAFEGITPGKADYVPVLSAVAAKKPEALYFGGYIQEAVILVNQMKQSGLTSTIFFGCDGTYGQDFVDRSKKNGEGAYAVSLVPPASDAKTKFDEAYKKQFGKEPGVLSPFTWNGYDVTAALVSVVKKVAVKGSDGNLYIPRGALVDGVRNLKDYKGLTGTITCDKVGECNATGPIFYIVKDGKWVAAEALK